MADAREDFDNYEEALKTMMDGRAKRIQTGMPGIIQSYNATHQTVVVQPAIQAVARDQYGVTAPMNIAPLSDVPVQFPSGGGFTLTFPIAAGDECWLSFSSRCIDGWWSRSGVQPPSHPRMHDFSDAVAHVGFRSMPRAIVASSTSTQLRSDDGASYVEIAAGHVVNIVAPGGCNIMGNVAITGTLNTTQTITSQQDVVTTAGIMLNEHHHVSTGGAGTSTGGPVG